MIAFGALIPLLILAGLIAGIAALARRNDNEPQDGFVRRLVISALTFGLTIVAVVGIALLVDIAFGSFDGLARSGSSDVAGALAMTLVGAPAAFFLWRYQLTALAGPDGRSVVWLLHMSLATAVFSIGTVIGLGNGLQFDDSGSRTALAFGLTFLGAWLFHEWLGRLRPAPLLRGLPRAIGGGVGLVTAAFGGLALINALISQLVESDDFIASSGRLDAVKSGAVWTAVGLAVWVWQFVMRQRSDELPEKALVLGLGVGGGALMGIGGLTAAVALLLDAITDRIDTQPLGEAVGAVAVGFLIWRYHRGLATSLRDVRVSRHLVSGISLIGLAVGIGVLVNAGLAALTPAFASVNEMDVLWTGLAALAVNGPIWALTWRPDRKPDPDHGSNVQRTYLTVLGGAAGVTGAIALIVLVYQLLEGLLEGDSLAAIVDGTRAPLGFVVATGLVTAYHYKAWAASRSDEDQPEPVTIERVTFVGSDTGVAEALRSDLGVRTTEWRSAGEGRVLASDELAAHLRSLDSTDVLVVEEERGYRVISLFRDGQRPHTGEPQE